MLDAGDHAAQIEDGLDGVAKAPQLGRERCRVGLVIERQDRRRQQRPKQLGG
jgi:hypothetical protein